MSSKREAEQSIDDIAPDIEKKVKNTITLPLVFWFSPRPHIIIDCRDMQIL